MESTCYGFQGALTRVGPASDAAAFDMLLSHRGTVATPAMKYKSSLMYLDRANFFHQSKKFTHDHSSNSETGTTLAVAGLADLCTGVGGVCALCLGLSTNVSGRRLLLCRLLLGMTGLHFSAMTK